MRFSPILFAALALAGCGKPAPKPTEESRALMEGMEQICAVYLEPGSSKKIEVYDQKMKALGWEIDNPPGIYMFNKEGAWGRVRIAIGADFKGACTVRAWPGESATVHDAAASAYALDAWVKKNAPDTRHELDRAKADGPPGALRSEWKGGGWSIVLKELPIKGSRPVTQLDVRRGIF